VPSAERPEGLNAETVEAVLDLTWKQLDHERERDASFNARAVGIAGFAGITGTLAGAVTRDLLGAQLLEPWRTIAAVVFVIAMVALGIAVAVVILGVLRPRESLSLGADEIRRYPTWEFVGADKALVQGRALLGLTRALLRQRERNDAKAGALRWGYRTLLAGLLAIVALGLTLGLRYADVLPEREQPEGCPDARTCAHRAFDTVRAIQSRSVPPPDRGGVVAGIDDETLSKKR